MRKYINKLKSKPEPVRKLAVYIALAFCMSIVFLIWYFNLIDRFDRQKVVEKSRQDVKPFKLISNGLSDAFNGVNSSFKKVSDIKKGEN